ncbi:MAG: putative signal transduction protein with EAL and GGDEF domain [Sulfurimonas sp.]|jgi:predicted signal transduction protein with EAL and GGDEF domain
MIDINNLKEYYDTYGHDSGDIVLFDLMKKTGAYFSTFSYNSQDNNRLNLTSYFY